MKEDNLHVRDVRVTPLVRLCFRVKEGSCPKPATTSGSCGRTTSSCRRATRRWSGWRWTTSCSGNRFATPVSEKHSPPVAHAGCLAVYVLPVKPASGNKTSHLFIETHGFKQKKWEEAPLCGWDGDGCRSDRSIRSRGLCVVL